MSDSYRDDIAEYALLAACVSVPAYLDQTLPVLTPGDFGHPSHAEIWKALNYLALHEQPTTLTVLKSQLQQAFRLNLVQSQVNVEALAYGECEHNVFRSVLDRTLAAARARRVLRVATRGQVVRENETPSEYADRVTAELLAAGETRGTVEPVSAAQAAMALDDELLARSEGTEVSVSTGLTAFDHALAGGFRPGQLVIEAGRPGTGKTSLLLKHAVTAARSGRGVLLFSLEMPAKELLLRLACDLASVDSQRAHHHRERLLPALQEISTLPLWIVDTPQQTVESVRSLALRWHAQHPLCLVGIDYLQLLDLQAQDSRDLQVATGRATRKLKVLARELGLPVVLLSQLNRDCEKRTNKRPLMSDLRDSGAIEQDADIVALIYRDVLYHRKTERPDVAEIDIAKHRAGAVGTIRVQYRPEYTRFADLDPNDNIPVRERPEADPYLDTPHWQEDAL